MELTSEMIKKELFSIYEGIAKSNNIDLIFQSSFQNAFKTKKNKYIQILSNLISNSVKYFDQNKAQKYVKISLRQDSNYIIADVEDNGLGIPEKHHATIYDMFRRYHPQVSFGTGLGMAIIKKNVEKIKGKIEFKSVESQGTQFTIRIPYTQGVI